METKKCNGCGVMQPISNFYIRKNGKVLTPCKRCKSLATTLNCHLRGASKPMNENKECASYLGVVVAEKALSKFYKHIKRMPINNPGYDFECDRGYKIDVKSACLYYSKHVNPYWKIHIRQNKIADYFLVLLFNDRKNLEPMHVLLIPGNIINNKIGIGISNAPKSLAKWAKYMQPLDNVIACCNVMKGGEKVNEL